MVKLNRGGAQWALALVTENLDALEVAYDATRMVKPPQLNAAAAALGSALKGVHCW